MTAICLSPNRRYVAIAEKSDKPIVTIYDLLQDQSKKRKVSYCVSYLIVLINLSFEDSINGAML